MFMQVTSAAARWRPSPCIYLELRARVRLARAWTIEADGRLLVLEGWWNELRPALSGAAAWVL